jgi:hypothetical protein
MLRRNHSENKSSRRNQSVLKNTRNTDKGLVTYTLGINKFADMTEEEMKAFTHGLVQPTQSPNTCSKSSLVSTGETGIVTPVKDQGGCGSCRAFSNLSNSCNLQERNEYSGLRLRLILLKSIGNNNWTISFYSFGTFTNINILFLCLSRKKHIGITTNCVVTKISDGDETKAILRVYTGSL